LIHMPLSLDEIDVSILKSLLEDGRKSFRQVSRDTGITTPTVKARYERLVNVGFIKGVIPVFDFEKVESKEKNLIQLQGLEEKTKRNMNFIRNHPNSNLEKEMDEIEKRIATGLAISVVCDFCDGPIHGKPRILKFADIERFFCCTSCKSGYSEKYRGRIESIKRKYEGKSEIDE
jgi:DNA-binding Lrp family transcriptional regulator